MMSKRKHQIDKDILGNVQGTSILFVWFGQYNTKMHQFLYPMFLLN
jgi:hypothetical protein